MSISKHLVIYIFCCCCLHVNRVLHCHLVVREISIACPQCGIIAGRYFDQLWLNFGCNILHPVHSQLQLACFVLDNLVCIAFWSYLWNFTPHRPIVKCRGPNIQFKILLTFQDTSNGSFNWDSLIMTKS